MKRLRYKLSYHIYLRKNLKKIAASRVKVTKMIERMIEKRPTSLVNVSSIIVLKTAAETAETGASTLFVSGK